MNPFSALTAPWEVPTNRLYQLRDEFLGRGGKVLDLISGNVSTQGVLFPSAILERAMRGGLRAAKLYKPDPLGQAPARAAVSRYYSREGWEIPAGQIVLTPGTSISYWYAFKLLADPGDEVLCPTPSYPLFDSIAALCGIRLVGYRLREAARWEIDFAQLESAITAKTKAIVLISPHNPTGSVAGAEELRRLAGIAVRRNLPIISDEVFSPFVFTPNGETQHLPRPASTNAPLVITMNGLSKMLALPGMKIGWMAITGQPALVKKSIKLLEMISDTFLPVHEAAQFALPTLLENSSSFQKSYAAEIQKRKDYVLSLLREQKSWSFAAPEGGFFLTLRLDAAGVDEEEVAIRLVKKHGILVHPGYFYDMEGQHLVFSFVSRPAILKKSLNLILEEIL
jgi:aspartate/methionine/tyrosine aminotransferase